VSDESRGAARTRLTPREAVGEILTAVGVLDAETVPLQAALGRVLAVPVVAPFDLPRWDNAAMDGYAVRGADLPVSGTTLAVVEEIAAGRFPARELGPGECARIFTGAPIPEGADGVIRQEDATRLDARTVRIEDLRDVDRNVRRRGEDVEDGTRVLEPGAELGPAQIGVLAALACADVGVHRRPRVAILGTGDEIATLEERDTILAGRKIASSNNYTMSAMALQAGAEVVDLGIARDDPAALRERLDLAAGADLIVTSGGMSVGEHDYLRALLQDAGGALLFWRIRMRPGAPVGFGRYGGVPWIGLPGNPVSTMVTFELFVRPAIRKLLGHGRLFRRATPVRLAEPVSTNASLQHFLRVTLTPETGALSARLTGPQGSGILSSMARADALLIVPENRDEIAEGETLQAIRLDESVHVPEAPY
jgi:molybdopterin molybdotransferase